MGIILKTVTEVSGLGVIDDNTPGMLLITSITITITITLSFLYYNLAANMTIPYQNSFN